MKIKVFIVVLAVVCIGLSIALIATQKQAGDRHARDVTSITEYANHLAEANEQVKEVGLVNLTLSNRLASSQEQVTQLSNSLAVANTTLADEETTLAATKTSLASVQGLVTNLNQRVTELEAKNQLLDQQAASLSNALAHLTAQIEETKKQLALSVTNSVFLQRALQTQLAQRAELEHKFNDLEELRRQVKKLKDELFIARRRQWLYSDTSIKKGGELLMMHNAPAASPSSRKPPASTYDLNVEIGSDGTRKVIPPPGRTNSPAH